MDAASAGSCRVLLGLMLVGCASHGPTAAPAPHEVGPAERAGLVSGTVSYRERMALPPDAVVELELADVSRPDATAPVVARTTVRAAGRQVTIPIELRYDAKAIHPDRTYAVRAMITSGGQPIFVTDAGYRVITQGNPSRADLRLVRAGGGPRSGSMLESTDWNLVNLGGQPVRTGSNIPVPNLRFLPEAQLRGSSGCNSIAGTYQQQGGSLRFGALVLTQLACVDPALNRQERTFVRTLVATRSWRVLGDTLILTGERGATVRFLAHARE